MRRVGMPVKGKKVLILGTGGTSKTLHAVAEDMGAGEIVTVSRTAGEGRVTYAEALAHHTDAGVIVNTTPVGMFPHGDGCPIDPGAFPQLCGVVDVVYNPLSTRLVSAARARGIPADIDRVYRAVLAEKRNIVLIGMPSCGKSTVGARIAGLLGRRLVDTDALVESVVGRSIPEIFAGEGEAAFRALEREAVASAAAGSGAVIATGGGAVLDPANVAALKQNGELFFLDRPTELLTATDDRPLARDRESLLKRYEERLPLYMSAADAHIDGAGSIDDVARAVIQKYKEDIS